MSFLSFAKSSAICGNFPLIYNIVANKDPFVTFIIRQFKSKSSRLPDSSIQKYPVNKTGTAGHPARSGSTGTPLWREIIGLVHQRASWDFLLAIPITEPKPTYSEAENKCPII